MRRLFRTKSLDPLLASSTNPEHQLRRTLGPVQLTFLGIGAIVGAGIFPRSVRLRPVGTDHIGAGPRLIVSFVIVAVACGFAALCYAEFAAMVPVAGSAYTYAYATLGELIAWIIGWDLILEYAVGNVAVAISWSDYFQSLLARFSFGLAALAGGGSSGPPARCRRPGCGARPSTCDLTHTRFRGSARMLKPWLTPLAFAGLPHRLQSARHPDRGLHHLAAGDRDSGELPVQHRHGHPQTGGCRPFRAVGRLLRPPENWHPFAPNGFAGISSAAAIIFFAYIGFDAISTAAEETRNPQRNMPIGDYRQPDRLHDHLYRGRPCADRHGEVEPCFKTRPIRWPRPLRIAG